MEIRHLRYLIAVAEEQSFVAAAARLQLAQPALSRQIRDLEREIGVELFIREASGTRLTSGGDACVRSARRLIEDVNAALDRARQAEHGLAGTCIIGAGRYPLWNGLMGRLLEAVRAEFPAIEILIDERSLRTQWDALATAEIDIAFGTAPPAEYVQFAVETHSLDIIDSVVLAKEHPLATRASLNLADLRAETWVRLAPSVADEPTRIVQSVFTSSGFVPKASRHAANDDALRMLVRSSAGWSVLPRSLRAVLPKNLVAIPVEDLAVPFRYVHIHRRGDNRPVVRSVLAAFRRAARREGYASSGEPDSGIKKLPERGRGGASRIELRHLRYFVAAVEHDSIGRAAETLGITQPALSRQLRDLEEDVGVALLARTARGIQPTLAGQSLYTDATRILRQAEQMAPEAQRALRGTSGSCVVGLAASPLIWETITLGVADCATRFPEVDVTVEDMPTPKQSAALREARVDITIGHQYPVVADLDPAVARLPLLPDRFNMALISTQHPLANRESIALKELGELPLLFMHRTFCPPLYDVVMSTFARAKYQPVVNSTHNGLTTVWALTAQGLGWCLGSGSQREFAPHGVVAVRLRDFDLPWGVEMVYRKDEARPAVLAVMQAIQEAARAVVEASMTSQEMKYWPQRALTG